MKAIIKDGYLVTVRIIDERRRFFVKQVKVVYRYKGEGEEKTAWVAESEIIDRVMP